MTLIRRMTSGCSRGLAAVALSSLLIPSGAYSVTASSVVSRNPTPASLGKDIFFDRSLSSSGRMSCATCHDPAFAHAQPNALAVQQGGDALDVPGFRAVPSLRYLNFSIPFQFQDDGTPAGGLNRDGRARTALDQANRPLLAPHEMANLTAAMLSERLSHAAYASDFRRVFGDDVFSDPDGALFRAQFALAAYEQNAKELHPFDSKYDLFLAGRIKLAPAEMRGLALFNRSDKGNCAACHPSARGAGGAPPLFTDYTYDNLGVPRNPDIAANDDPAYYDLGLGGPFRADLAGRPDLCGAFKVPTLRNVATRQVFFHNGRFKTLTDALTFYVRRNTNPEEFYPVVNGTVAKFDDLPAALRGNVNTEEVPYDRRPGEPPRLDATEIQDLIAFLKTLTDGYDPATDTADPARSLVAQP